MSMIFKFRMLSDENDNFVRDYEVAYDMSLLDFHDFICDDLGYDESNMSSLFTSNQQWEKLQEFTLMDMDEQGGEFSPIPMGDVTLGQIFHKKNGRLIFQYDIFADRSFFLEMLEAKESEEGKSYPATTLAEGEAPDQFDVTKISGGGSIFDDAMDEFSEFEGEEFYDDEF